ncbi:glycerol-3-phosphate acyltransferase [Calidithermus timidus]|uniref:glycerol-3-phosphate acyltransferase n=1 Tax=Calidithermus timidus TaxID=307124 RepID=UPI00036F426B
MDYLNALLAGYFFGSLPFAYWFGLLQGKNLMAEGSGNVGALNALRVLGVIPGLMVLLLDVAKGLMAVAIGEFLGKSFEAGLLAGAAAVWGHCFSAWLLGRGGKGLAPAAGVLLAVKPLMLLFSFALIGLIYLLSRSLYRAIALVALCLPVIAASVGQATPYIWFGFGVGIPIALRHLPEWNRRSLPKPKERSQSR